MVLLDTSALLWLWAGDARLGPQARETIDVALHNERLAVSAITFCEVAMLRDKGRLDFPDDVGLWRRELLANGLVEDSGDRGPSDTGGGAGGYPRGSRGPPDRGDGAGRAPAGDKRSADSGVGGDVGSAEFAGVTVGWTVVASGRTSGGPLTDFRRRRRNLPLPLERVKNGGLGLGAWGCVVRHGPPTDSGPAHHERVGLVAWQSGGPLTGFGRGTGRTCLSPRRG